MKLKLEKKSKLTRAQQIVLQLDGLMYSALLLDLCLHRCNPAKEFLELCHP